MNFLTGLIDLMFWLPIIIFIFYPIIAGLLTVALYVRIYFLHFHKRKQPLIK